MRRQETQRTLIVDPREDRQDIAVLAMKCSRQIERPRHVARPDVVEAPILHAWRCVGQPSRSASIPLDPPATWPALDDPRLIDKRLHPKASSRVR